MRHICRIYAVKYNASIACGNIVACDDRIGHTASLHTNTPTAIAQRARIAAVNSGDGIAQYQVPI